MESVWYDGGAQVVQERSRRVEMGEDGSNQVAVVIEFLRSHPRLLV